MSHKTLFTYTLLLGDGTRQTGQIEADSVGAAKDLLLDKPGTLVSIKEALQQTPLNRKGQKVEIVDLMLFSKQMGTMLKSGVPILRALGACASNQDSPMAPHAQTILEDLQKGKPLSTSLASNPKIFDAYYISMIKIGESTGNTETIFEKLHAHLAFKKHMQEQVKTALRYPAIVVFVILAALLIVNFFVIPAFAKVYAGFKAELPIFTKILVASSNFITSYWLLIFAALSLLTFFFIRWKNGPGRLTWDEFKLKTPIAGNIIIRSTMARFCQSLAMSLSAGLPISSAIGLVGETTENSWISQKLIQIKQQLERGESLHKACSSSKIFTTITLQMILIGEESGSLDALLLDVATLYQEEVEYDLKTISSQLEPYLLLFLGTLVMVLALGIFLPIWNLSSAAFPTNK